MTEKLAGVGTGSRPSSGWPQRSGDDVVDERRRGLSAFEEDTEEHGTDKCGEQLVGSGTLGAIAAPQSPFDGRVERSDVSRHESISHFSTGFVEVAAADQHRRQLDHGRLRQQPGGVT